MHTHVAQDSRRLLVTYKEPRNDAAICSDVREGTDRSPRNTEAEGRIISNSDSRMCERSILSAGL